MAGLIETLAGLLGGAPPSLFTAIVVAKAFAIMLVIGHASHHHHHPTAA